MDLVCFGPFLRLYEQREELTSGAAVSASSQREEAKKLIADYENALTDVRVEAMSERMTSVSAASEEASKLVSGAEDKAKEKIQAARAEVESSLEPLRAELMKASDQLVDDIVSSLKTAPKPADKGTGSSAIH